ncbi:hypothetical protein M8C21_033318 [Ambrosia artemisiifolia]|uniref:Uncharacterized protein n=1 Tax=Ambrosia artemisiifolia TaxID=4212 RepID=A0AAD5CUM2_AMBAR|nr:hypothetical protein M8C21_033318 [Ambrosia artemisiifolia]
MFSGMKIVGLFHPSFEPRSCGDENNIVAFGRRFAIIQMVEIIYAVMVYAECTKVSSNVFKDLEENDYYHPTCKDEPTIFAAPKVNVATEKKEEGEASNTTEGEGEEEEKTDDAAAAAPRRRNRRDT